MIRYGAHCYIFTDRWADDQLHHLETARSLGLSMFELAVGDDVAFTAGLTRREAEKLQLDLAIGPGGEWPLACDLSADAPDERALGLRWHQQQVDLAAELGAIAYAGALYGHPGVVKRRVPPADELAWTAHGLHALAEYGQQRQVKIVLEPMSHFRTHLINTPQQTMALIALADHENLYALFDTYHLITEITDYRAGLHMVAPRLWCIHACENNRGVPGSGLVPWNTLFGALAESNFDGYVTLEAYNSSINDFAIRRGMFHNVCTDGAEFVQQGVAFLQHMAQKHGVESSLDRGVQ